jgi:hypothetical protein
MKKSLAITLATAALILVAAFATLAVLTAVAGQKSGIEKATAVNCAKLTPAAAQAVTDPHHGERLTARARCTTSQNG